MARDTLTARLVCYSGRVQGVGFRATTSALARSFQVSGWVRNLSDSRVELHAEGGKAEVERFLQAVRERWRGYIENEDVQETPRYGYFFAHDS